MGEIADALRRARTKKRASGDEGPNAERVSLAARKARGELALAASSPPETTALGIPDLSLPESPGEEGGAEIATASRRKGARAAREVLVHRGGPAAECYRQFALRVRRELEHRGAKSLLLIGALREEGKTTTACNLALALASMAGGRRMALVDLDLRRPSIATALGVPVETGIETVLRGQAPLRAACIRTDVRQLDLFLVGRAQGSPEDLLAGPICAAVLQALEEAYATVVIDTAPVLLVPDAPLLAVQAGAWVLVARAGRTRTHSIRATLEALPREKLIGNFLNEGKPPVHAKQYGYYLDSEA
jgi:capsular exopolysaccharide synthesis family protein